MRVSYRTDEICAATGLTQSSISRRAADERWPFDLEKSAKRGKPPRVYSFASLPEDVRIAVTLWEEQEGKAGSTGENIMAIEPVQSLELTTSPDRFCPITDEHRKKSLARASLVRLYLQYCKKGKKWGRRGQVKDEFVTAYNNGSYPDLFAVIGTTSVKSIERWKLQLGRTDDPFALADNRGKHRKGLISVTPEQGKILERVALSPNAPPISEAIRIARARFAAEGIQDGHSDATYRRYLERFKKNHYPEWIFHRQGQTALNKQCIFHIRRDYNLIQVGDLIVADGHILNFEVLNPWSGRPKRMMLLLWYDMASNYPLGYDIMPTENTGAISAALRRAILTLGKIPRVAYMDNGRAFRARFFTQVSDLRQTELPGLYERLGIRTIFAWPYHAESKPVERFFETLGELERLAPSYVGTSIATQPPRLNRGEKIHTKIYDKATGGRAPTLIETYRALAAWFDEYARRPQRGHLNGRCPLEVFEAGRGEGFDAYGRERLRLLMSRHEVRRIGRDGIKLPWSDCNYYAPELYGRQMESAIVLYDELDAESICVYGQDGELICEARRMDKVHPAAAHLGTPEDREKLRAQIELKRSMEKKTVGPARAFLESDVLPEVQQRMEQIGFAGGEVPTRLPVMNRTERSRLIGEPTEADLAAQVARIESYQGPVIDVEAIETEAAEIERRMREAGPIEPSSNLFSGTRPIFATDVDRYRWCIERQAKGCGLDQGDLQFMGEFETKMDEATAVYWEMQRELLGSAAAG